MELPCPCPDVELSPCLGGTESSPSVAYSRGVYGGGWEECTRARAASCCLTQTRNLSPSPIKWLKKYLSHRRDEERAAREGVWVFELI